MLSCSDLQSAQALSTLLPKVEIQATHGLVRIHGDGGISTIARAGAEEGWVVFKNGENIGKAPTPEGPGKAFRESYVQMGEDLVKVGSSFSKKLDDLNLSTLKEYLEKLDEVTRNKFLDDFAGASDDVLKKLNADDDLVSLWKKYSGEFKGTKYITEQGVFKTCQSVLDNHSDVYLGNLVKEVMDAPKPTNSEQVLVGVTHPSFNGKVFMGNNFKNSESALEAAFKTETAHPLIRERIKYMDFIRNSVTDGTDKIINEALANKLLNIDNLGKLTTSGRAGYHGEVRALSDALYELEKIKPVTSSTLSEFDLFIRNSSDQVMQRCPCCFYITKGVKVLGGN